ncbi:Guanine/hypoxanthine permease PbuO [Mycoplasmopsis californica]|uniref:NCS2 family permease n=1 Tax=Mycoplasmopsis equigenitalium TaxID=114883 RepID=A0ABY5J0C9_9BACT|nr:NCS2 family permease [Mycoplasmopsis equigenitalium]UUD36679.1 NCS2 family permease [Mycoplasmopsis equigenitalium]VEU69358.1 Guanine/hypoxanthine permease PbuO [Mycoplasmopsis californica]
MNQNNDIDNDIRQNNPENSQNVNGNGVVTQKKQSWVDRFFRLSERNTNWKREIIAGIITFLAMCYILVVNPSMLEFRVDKLDINGKPIIDAVTGKPETVVLGLPWGGAFLATALSAFVGTMVMGFFGNLPLGLAPGMGINAFFTYVVMGQFKYKPEEALGAALLAGLLFLIISLTPLRRIMIKAIPKDLKLAIGAGIGFFIAFVGLQNAGIIVKNPGTAVALGDLTQPKVLLALGGIVLSIILYSINFKFNFIVSIVATTVVGIIINYIYYAVNNGATLDGLPKFEGFDYSTLAEYKNVIGKGVVAIFTQNFWKISLIGILVSFLFVDMFDTIGTFMGVTEPLGIVDEKGELKGAHKGLISDSIATVAGAVLGTSAVTTYIESTAGIKAGGKTGLTAVTIAVLFALSIPLFPAIKIFSTSASTSMVLFTVGAMMVVQLKNLNWEDVTITLPAFATILFMTLTYSITNGIAFGFISFVVMQMVRGKFKEIHPMMYGLAVAFIAYFALTALLV